MIRTWNFACIFLQIIIFVRATGHYTIVSPGTIQSHTDFSVGVTLHDSPERATVKLSIEGPSYNESKTVDVAPSQVKVVNFNVPQIKSGLYFLNVNGLKGVIFENFTNLVYRDRNPMIYIQTDKAIYKPEELVLYRVVVLDEEVRPIKPIRPLKLYLRDGIGNIVKQLNDVNLTKGVYSGEFPLSEEPILGEWMLEINLDHNGDITKAGKTFEVAKYVLPKFSFEIVTTEHITYEDPVKITIRAKYTYGKPVKGKATINLETNFGQSKAEKVVDVIEGKGFVEFDLIKDLGVEKPKADPKFGMFAYHYPPPVHVSAVMTEEYTGSKLEQKKQIYLHKSRFFIESLSNINDYYANVPFQLKAVVKTIDGSPAKFDKYPAKLKIEKQRTYNSPDQPLATQFVFSSEVDANGIAVFNVVLPNVEHYHSVVVTYFDQFVDMNGLKGHDKQELPDETFKLVKKTKGLEVDQDIVVEVQYSDSISYYVYALVARGNIIKHELVRISGYGRSNQIKFRTSFQMVPNAYLYVYYVENGDLKFQEMAFNFRREFYNKVEITAPNEVKPGEEIRLKVKTDPDSFVCVLGVDQRVLMLKSGNDFNYNKIMDDLNYHGTVTPIIPGSGRYPGRTSGLVTLTNANFPYTLKRKRERPKSQFVPIMAAVGGIKPNTDAQYIKTTTAISIPQYSENIDEHKTITVRQNFQESWFMELNVKNSDPSGITTFVKTVPDDITSWVVTGFSVNEKSGFGMVENPKNVKVFQPFFVTTNLPYSVKRGEVIAIPVILFNYMDANLEAEVIMENVDGDYEFTEVANDTDVLVLTEKQRVKKVSLPSNEGKSISFMIRPNKVGDITLIIKATTLLAGDTLQQNLKVEAEGITQYDNKAIFATPSFLNSTRETLKAVIPADAVKESEYLEFTVVGDILGPTIMNIGNLVRKPRGCGEQNMINFVPNILVLQYLEAIGHVMPDVTEKAKDFMEIGYQRQLIYKHKNGAFSSFGSKISEPNSWLTAYVARSFIQARKYIIVDENIIDNALQYLLTNQLKSGQFEQTGRLIIPSHQNAVGFTAFVLLALLEDDHYTNKYRSEIDKGLKYLAESIEKETDNYALAMTLLVFRKSQHPSAGKLKEKLDKAATDEQGLRYWSQSAKKKKFSNDVEVTSYVLEAYLYTEPVGNLLPIIRWLIAHRNNLGGYDSTQDTVVGLQALIKFAEKHARMPHGRTTIQYEARDDKGKLTTRGQFTVDKENSLLVQSHVLPKSTRNVTLEAQGEGSSLVYLSYHYNVDAKAKDSKPSFNIKQTFQKLDKPNLMKMNVCSSYIGTDVKETNMAILEVFLPSGFTVMDESDKIRQAKKVQRVETKNADTAIIVYFEFLATGEELCIEVNAEKTHAVSKQKPSAITIYDYYNSDQRTTIYYELKSSLCDMCEPGECGKACVKKSSKGGD